MKGYRSRPRLRVSAPACSVCEGAREDDSWTDSFSFRPLSLCFSLALLRSWLFAHVLLSCLAPLSFVIRTLCPLPCSHDHVFLARADDAHLLQATYNMVFGRNLKTRIFGYNVDRQSGDLLDIIPQHKDAYKSGSNVRCCVCVECYGIVWLTDAQ